MIMMTDGSRRDGQLLALEHLSFYLHYLGRLWKNAFISLHHLPRCSHVLGQSTRTQAQPSLGQDWDMGFGRGAQVWI